MVETFVLICILSLVIWLFLLLFWGQFWRTNQRLQTERNPLDFYPSVCAVIPARNEAEVLPDSLNSLLQQEYPGIFYLILVDDQSTDGTAKIAREVADKLNKQSQLKIINTPSLPSGWSGKLWAMEQGIKATNDLSFTPDYLLLTDADIHHDSVNLKHLVEKAQKDNLDLVSLMVLLRSQNWWEKFLIPAFVFFFQKLYPFPWVNNPDKKIAAAAGGCILMRRQVLEEIGGISIVKNALIDDCALAKAVKSRKGGGKIWLGLTKLTYSLRAYDSLSTIWEMVARTAFTQLNYSPWLLIGTLIGMGLVYLLPIVSLLLGLWWSNWLLICVGGLTLVLMAIAYFPTVRLYQVSWWWACALPAIAFLYTLMTIDSARRHWQGKGGAWKGRVYPG